MTLRYISYHYHYVELLASLTEYRYGYKVAKAWLYGTFLFLGTFKSVYDSSVSVSIFSMSG
jgi:hypothetical protein